MDEPRTAKDLYVLDDGCCPHGSLLDLAAYRRKVQRESLRLARDAVRDVGDRILIPSDPDPEDVIVDALAAIDRLMEDPKVIRLSADGETVEPCHADASGPTKIVLADHRGDGGAMMERPIVTVTVNMGERLLQGGTVDLPDLPPGTRVRFRVVSDPEPSAAPLQIEGPVGNGAVVSGWSVQGIGIEFVDPGPTLDVRPCTYRGCGQPESATIHPGPDGRMGGGRHVYRHEPRKYIEGARS